GGSRLAGSHRGLRLVVGGLEVGRVQAGVGPFRGQGAGRDADGLVARDGTVVGVEDEDALLARLELRGVIPAHVRAPGEAHDDAVLARPALVDLLYLDDGLPPERVVFADRLVRGRHAGGGRTTYSHAEPHTLDTDHTPR